MEIESEIRKGKEVTEFKKFMKIEIIILALFMIFLMIYGLFKLIPITWIFLAAFALIKSVFIGWIFSKFTDPIFETLKDFFNYLKKEMS